MASFEALYGQKFRSPIYFSEVGESKLLGPALVQLTKENARFTRKKTKTAQSHQKSYELSEDESWSMRRETSYLWRFLPHMASRGSEEKWN